MGTDFSLSPFNKDVGRRAGEKSPALFLCRVRAAFSCRLHSARELLGEVSEREFAREVRGVDHAFHRTLSSSRLHVDRATDRARTRLGLGVFESFDLDVLHEDLLVDPLLIRKPDAEIAEVVELVGIDWQVRGVGVESLWQELLQREVPEGHSVRQQDQVKEEIPSVRDEKHAARKRYPEGRVKQRYDGVRRSAAISGQTDSSYGVSGAKSSSAARRARYLNTAFTDSIANAQARFGPMICLTSTIPI